MTDQQKRFFDLAVRQEQLIEELKKNREEIEVVMTQLGLNTYHQDPQTLLVYKIEKPKGTFTYYRDIDFKRTAKPGEKGGTVLAKSEAEAQGFLLLK
jgi:hypothetical protein